ncbi:unnamed protein product [Penicillium salamii]|nr:unnamed protein product [Penicillium salamii]
MLNLIQHIPVKDFPYNYVFHLIYQGNQPNLYQPNAFVYSSESFLTTSSNDEGFHIILHAHNLDR